MSSTRDDENGGKRMLLEEVRRACRRRQFSPRTEKAYVGWIRRFVRACRPQHPRDAREPAVVEFLTRLANEGKVAASTQNQALSALLFLYRDVLQEPLEELPGLERARRPRRLPSVLSRSQAQALLEQMAGRDLLMASLLYGSGLRVLECCRLRLKDLALDREEVCIRDGKGRRDRVSKLPKRTLPELRAQIEHVRALHAKDLGNGAGAAPLPHALARKSPSAATSPGWQWLFPGSTIHAVPGTERRGRYHLHPTVIQRAVKEAAIRAGITSRATCHTLRHSFATHLLQAGQDIRTIQELMGHRDVSTTMVYLHVLNRGGLGVTSPLDLP